MKKKFSRILGVALTIALLTSLMVVATPVSAADLSWSAATLPATGARAGWVIGPAGLNITHLIVVPDGSRMWAADNSAAPFIYFSTDGGHRWTAATRGPAAAPTAIAVSPTYSTDLTLYCAATVAGVGTLYRSVNGGVTWAQADVGIAGEVITSIALSPTHSADNLVIVGTTNVGAGATAATLGDVFQMGRAGTFGLANNPLNLVADVTSVAFSPNYPTDRVILAVGSRPAGTNLHSNVNWEAAWDTAYAAPAAAAPAAINAAITGVGDGAAAIVSSSIALPSDYDGSVATSRVAFVATVSGTAANDQVYRVNNLAATALTAGTVAAPTQRSSLAYSGTLVAGTLFSGDFAAAQVRRATTALTATAAAPPRWIPAVAVSAMVRARKVKASFSAVDLEGKS